MSSRVSLTCHCFAVAMTAGTVVMSAIFTSKPGLAQPAPAGRTTSIPRNSDKAREMKEPSFQTREERLNAMPLDWNSTIGTPAPRTQPGALEGQSSAGGAPNPGAEEEAHKLHPDDWK